MAVGYAIVAGVKFLIAQFDLLGTELAGIMIIISVLLLVCSFIIAGAFRNNKRKDDKQVHPEKAYIYSNFINYYITIRESIRKTGAINYRFRSDITLWAGKNVLKSYMQFNKNLDELNPDNPKIMEQAEKVIFEMRKELGHDNYGFNEGDIDKLIFPEESQLENKVQSAKMKSS